MKNQSTVYSSVNCGNKQRFLQKKRLCLSQSKDKRGLNQKCVTIRESSLPIHQRYHDAIVEMHTMRDVLCCDGNVIMEIPRVTS